MKKVDIKFEWFCSGCKALNKKPDVYRVCSIEIDGVYEEIVENCFGYFLLNLEEEINASIVNEAIESSLTICPSCRRSGEHNRGKVIVDKYEVKR
jgi:hypothetical protein